MQAHSKIAKVGLALTLVASMGVAAVPVTASAQPNGVIGCSAPGKKQEGGAIIGAILGGLIGNKVARNEQTAGTLVGAGLGAAAGSAIGCQAQKKEAVNSGTYVSNGYRIANYVQPANFQKAGGRFIATSTVNLRSGPSTGAGKVGQLTRGETFTAMAYAKRGDWVLVSRNGVGVGYVNGAYVRPTGYQNASW
ncbi:MAG: SH3 domain-containing protein [Caulobacteraceae bacterium]|nr:MAG: SH3 domain-containing protein [Caulobacteraceae bacterium]